MNTRKDFLIGSSLFALAPAIADAASGSPSPSAKPKEPTLTFTFDQARFNAILSEAAKHKQCFGATKIDDGSVLYGMNNSIRAYEDVLKERLGTMQTVAVLYHGLSILLGMNDAVWNELFTPLAHDKVFRKSLSIEDHADVAKLQLGKGNPYLRSATSDPADVSVERLASQGASFFVCHNAIVGFSWGLARATRIPVERVHQRLLAGIVPGALVVPAGVMAINACQEAKFTYIQSSL